MSEIKAVLNHSNPILDISTTPPASPPSSGQIFLFDKSTTKDYKQDGHQWRKRKNSNKNSNKIHENHIRLRKGGKFCVSGFYTYSSTCASFQRRSYYLVDPEKGTVLYPCTRLSHLESGPLQRSLILVHYLDTSQSTSNHYSVSVSNGVSDASSNGGSVSLLNTDTNRGTVSSTSTSALNEAYSLNINSDSDSSGNDDDTSLSSIVNTGNVTGDIDLLKWQYDAGNIESYLGSTCRCQKCNMTIPLNQKRLFMIQRDTRRHSIFRKKNMHPYCFDIKEIYGTPSFIPMGDEITSNPKTLATAFAQKYVDIQSWTDEEFQEFIRCLEKGLSNDRVVHTDHPSDWRMEPEIKIKLRGVNVPLTGVTRMKVNHENEKDKFICPGCLPGIVRRIGNTDRAECDNIDCGREFTICDACVSIRGILGLGAKTHRETASHIRNVRTKQTNEGKQKHCIFKKRSNLKLITILFDHKSTI